MQTLRVPALCITNYSVIARFLFRSLIIINIKMSLEKVIRDICMSNLRWKRQFIDRFSKVTKSSASSLLTYQVLIIMRPDREVCFLLPGLFIMLQAIGDYSYFNQKNFCFCVYNFLRRIPKSASI